MTIIIKMKLLRSPNAFLSSLRNLGSTSSRISAAASASTETPASNSLLFRVTNGVDHRASIFPILEQWVDEGRPLHKEYIQEMVKKLKKMKRHAHALEAGPAARNTREMVGMCSPFIGDEHGGRFGSI